jgi:hypothetical protein
MGGCGAGAREDGILRPQADERPVSAARASVAS